MLNGREATDIVVKAFPTGDIQAYVGYENLFIFQIFSKDPGEEEMDPFYSVNRETGEFRDFSVITDGDTATIIGLFTKAKEGTL